MKDRRHTLSDIHPEKSRQDKYKEGDNSNISSNDPVFSFPTDTIIPISMAPSSSPEKLADIKGQISNIGKSLDSSIKNVMGRGDNLGDLYNKTFTLEKQSANFKRRSSIVKETTEKNERRYNWSIGIGVVLVITLVIFGIFQIFKDWFIRMLERRLVMEE